MPKCVQNLENRIKRNSVKKKKKKKSAIMKLFSVIKKREKFNKKRKTN